MIFEGHVTTISCTTDVPLWKQDTITLFQVQIVSFQRVTKITISVKDYILQMGKLYTVLYKLVLKSHNAEADISSEYE